MPNTDLPNISVGTTGRIAQTNVVHDEINTLSRDTGLRDVTSLLVNGWTATSVYLERIRDHVYLYLRGLDGSAATSTTFLQQGILGGGWKPMESTFRSAAYWDSNNEPNARVTINGGAFLGTTGVVWTGQFSVIEYRTLDTFPSTFPGTAV